MPAYPTIKLIFPKIFQTFVMLETMSDTALKCILLSRICRDLISSVFEESICENDKLAHFSCDVAIWCRLPATNTQHVSRFNAVCAKHANGSDGFLPCNQRLLFVSGIRGHAWLTHIMTWQPHFTECSTETAADSAICATRFDQPDAFPSNHPPVLFSNIQTARGS
jgi:hypothetical protein